MMTFCKHALATAVVGLGFGCSHHHEHSPDPANLPHFHDLAEASPSIQTAASAVVRIGTARLFATGAFIAPNGLLITNNHVLGDTECPVEGCTVELTFMYQRGAVRQEPRVLFAVPKAVDVGLDMAVAQIYDAPGGSELTTPDYLSLKAVDSTALLGLHVTVVGHPEGNLKKWTDGEVVEVDGDWFVSTAYTLPGDSGSPLLDDTGSMVGLIHRGPTGEDLFTTSSANVYSVGTPAEPILSVTSAPLPPTMVSTAAATTASEAVVNQGIYLNARVDSVPVGGVVTGLVELLGQACDEGLARLDLRSIDDLWEALAPCNAAMTWIDCRSDVASTYGGACPADPAAWRDRFLGVNQHWRDMNGQLSPYAVSFAIARLLPTRAAGKSAGAQTLDSALAEAQPLLDFTLANYLVAFGKAEYSGVSLLEYTQAYQKVLHYELQAASIANTATWLYAGGLMSKANMLGLLAGLQADPNVGIGDRLYIETTRYEYDAL